jgi:uncharacterized protein DUF6152
MRTKIMLVSAAIMAAQAAWAHHAFAQEFDEKRPLKLVGTVTKWEVINPHSWVHLDVKGPDGKVTNWMIEGGSPNALFRQGFTKDSLPVGSEIVVEGFQAKDGSNRGVGSNLVFKDGRKLFLSNTASPSESGPAPEK